jgi:hypothetical protein
MSTAGDPGSGVSEFRWVLVGALGLLVLLTSLFLGGPGIFVIVLGLCVALAGVAIAASGRAPWAWLRHKVTIGVAVVTGIALVALGAATLPGMSRLAPGTGSGVVAEEAGAPTTTTTTLPPLTEEPTSEPPTTTKPPRTTTTTTTPSRPNLGFCEPAYPTVCVLRNLPRVDCKRLPYRHFPALPPDPYNLDKDHNGIACENGGR